MKTTRFAQLIRMFSGMRSRRDPFAQLLSRRATIGGLGALTLPRLVDAKKRKRKKKHRKKHKKKSKETCGKAGSQPVKGTCCAGSVFVDGACRRCDVCASGCEFASLQVAIDAASPETTIAVCPGRYRFQNLLISQDVRLVGAGDGEGAGDTIVQGTGEGSVVTISGEDIVVALEQLRLTGGGGGDTSGGGLSNDNGEHGATVLIGCTVSGNTARHGGGIYTSASTLNMIGCTVSGNTAGSGGGITLLGGTLTLTDCTVSGNAATDTTVGFGGGIASDGIVILTGSEVSGNTAAGFGGGISNSLNNLSLVNSEVSGNFAGTRGGGIWNGINVKATLDAASRVTGNTAGTAGGGIYNSSGTVTLASSENVTGNTPSNCAGTAVPMCSG